MGKKLVLLEVDDNGVPCGDAVNVFASEIEDAIADEAAGNPKVNARERAIGCLASLPSALLIGAEEREELAKTIYDCDALGRNWKWDDAGDYARRKREKYLAVCDAILAAGWRKVAAVDREKLVEAIVGLIHDERYAVGKTCLPPFDTARALLARVEGETAG